MNTLRTLHDAFAELEKRAELGPAPARPSRGHFVAPILTATAVAVVVAGVALWQPATHQTVQPASSPKKTSGTFTPPDTAAKLAAKARAILAGTATVDVDDSRSSDCGAASMPLPGPKQNGPIPPSSCSGAAIGGKLTSGGETGGFDLAVFRAKPNAQAACDPPGKCTISMRPDRSTLAVGLWQDPQLPGGVTMTVELVRPDGADILVHLSTEDDSKGRGPLLGTRLPLTVAQLTAFVTSDRW